jgi:hypothetical protein
LLLILAGYCLLPFFTTADVIGRGIQETLSEENCELLRKNLLVALSKCLRDKTKVSQARVRSKHYNQECEALKNWFVHKNSNGNLYIRSFLYILTGVFLRELERGLT